MRTSNRDDQSRARRSTRRRRDSGQEPRLDLDTCSIDELARVDGISRTMAEHIVEYRDAHGGRFEGFEELCHVPGMTPLTINKLRALGAL